MTHNLPVWCQFIETSAVCLRCTQPTMQSPFFNVYFHHSSIILLRDSLESCGWKKNKPKWCCSLLVQEVLWTCKRAVQSCKIDCSVPIFFMLGLITIKVIFTSNNLNFEVTVHFWPAYSTSFTLDIYAKAQLINWSVNYARASLFSNCNVATSRRKNLQPVYWNSAALHANATSWLWQKIATCTIVPSRLHSLTCL